MFAECTNVKVGVEMLIFVLKSRSSGGIKKHVAQLVSGLGKLGYQVKLFELSFNPIHFLLNIVTIRREIKKNKPDLIHYHGFKAMLYNFFIQKGCKTICTIHGFLELKSFGSKIFKKILISLAPKINMFICVSKELQNHLSKEFKISLQKTTVIYNGVNVPFYSVKRPETPRIIGACGRLVDIKGYHLLIEAFNKLKEKHQIQLHLIGDGPEIDNLKKIAKEKVYFHGYQKDPLLYMNYFNIFVQPSLLEGCGVAVLEAMSINLPVIISDAGGLPELVNDKKDGLIFKKGNTDDLINKLEMLLTNPKVYQEIGKNNKQKVIKSFSYNKMLESTIEIYQSLGGDEVYEQII